MGDAVRSPRTVVVHFGNTPTGKSDEEFTDPEFEWTSSTTFYTICNDELAAVYMPRIYGTIADGERFHPSHVGSRHQPLRLKEGDRDRRNRPGNSTPKCRERKGESSKFHPSEVARTRNGRRNIVRNRPGS